MNLTEQLVRLAEIAPDVCKFLDRQSFGHNVYSLGDYHFFIDDDGQPAISSPVNSWQYIKGKPALAWLTDALKTAIESRGWFYEMSFWSYGNKPRYRVRIASANVAVVDEETKAGALLAALIEALA